MNNPNAVINSDYGPIIININDAIIGKHISKFGYWAKDDLDLIKSLLDFLFTKKDSIVFYDVGANIGTHALAVGKTYKQKIKVRAFEAQRQVFNMMCGTVALNGLDNVFCHHLAVSSEKGSLIQVPVPDYGESNNFGGLELIEPKRSDNQHMKKISYEEVETTTLDFFNEIVDFMKIDIEGMEDKALDGARLILEQHKPICFIEILKTDVDYVIEVFKRSGYLGFQKGTDLIAIPVEYQIQVNGLNRVF